MRPLMAAPCLLLATAAAITASQAARTAQSGIYTTAQALRGKADYKQHCSYCHHDDLLGGEDLAVIPPALVGLAFEEQFLGRSAGHMFRQVADTMPWRRKPLAPREYADIISYLLQENGFPAGDRELPPDPALLDDVVISRGQ